MSENGKHRMYADFSEDAYNEYLAGNAELNNNGFRSVKGNYMPDQPEFSEIENPDGGSETTDSSNLLTMAIVVAVSIGGTLVATKVAPHVKLWWNDKAYPSIVSNWRKLTKQEKTAQCIKCENSSQVDVFELASQSKTTAADFSMQIDKAFNNYKENMSSSEAQEHILAIMGAAAFIADEIRKLSNTCIKDDSEFLELKATMEKLVTQQVTDSINLILEQKSYILDEKTSLTFFKYFGGGGFVDGKYVSLQNEKVKEALSFYKAET